VLAARSHSALETEKATIQEQLQGAVTEVCIYQHAMIQYSDTLLDLSHCRIDSMQRYKHSAANDNVLRC
jgi:hypothetical protein